MWFNNVVIYPMKEPIAYSSEEMQQALEEYRLKPCPPHARQSQGWVNPFNGLTEKLHSIYGCHLLIAAKEVRLLPTSIVQTVLEEKMTEFAVLHQRPMRRAERLQLKEEIEFDLLPKAFTAQKKDWLYIDTVKHWIVINTANLNKAAEIMLLLVKTLGAVSAFPLNCETSVSHLFSRWLEEPQSMPEGLLLGKHCVLIESKDNKSQYNCKNIEQNRDEIITLLQRDYTVSSLELVWLDRIQFTLTDNLILKRLKCIDYLEDAFKDNHSLDNEIEQFDANFALFAGEIRALTSFLINTCFSKNSSLEPLEQIKCLA